MEIVIEHPVEFHAYRVGYDTPSSIARAVGERIVASRRPPRFTIMTKSGPKDAVIGDFIVKRGPGEIEVLTAAEFHEKYVFKRAVSQGRRIKRTHKPHVKWDEYLPPEEETPMSVHTARKKEAEKQARKEE